MLGVIVPAYCDGSAAKSLIVSLLSSADRCPIPVSIAVADNGGNCGFNGGLPEDPRLFTVQVSKRGPGHARTAGTQALLAKWRERMGSLDNAWLVSLDADTRIEIDFLQQWITTISQSTADVLVATQLLRALPGERAADQDVKAACTWLWSHAELCETFVGIVNIGGCNHALLASLCSVNEYYVQPVATIGGRQVILAGEDWDFGLRARLNGFSIQRVGSPACVTSARRIVNDPAGFLAGRTYEKPFHPVSVAEVAPPWPPAEQWAALADAGRARIVAHFLLKPIIAGLHPAPSLRWFLGDRLRAELEEMPRMNRPVQSDWQEYRNNLISYLFEPQTIDLARRIGRQLAGLAS